MMQWIIAGLGNPGTEHSHTRHNVGRDMVDSYATSAGAQFDPKRVHKSLIADASIEGANIKLVLPETFMNDSGKAFTKLIKSPEDAARLVVVYDEIDLPLGEVRIAWARGSAGHNGIKSIMECLKTKAFLRVRIGIAPVIDGITTKPKGGKNVVNFVLGKFRPEEKAILKEVTKKVVNILNDIMVMKREEVMNKYN